MWRWIGTRIVDGVIVAIAGLVTVQAYQNWPKNIAWRDRATELATDAIAQTAVAPVVLMILLISIYLARFGFGIDRISPLSKVLWFGISLGTLVPLAVHSAFGTADAALDTFKGGSISFAIILGISAWLILKRAVRVLRDGESEPLPKWPSKAG